MKPVRFVIDMFWSASLHAKSLTFHFARNLNRAGPVRQKKPPFKLGFAFTRHRFGPIRFHSVEPMRTAPKMINEIARPCVSVPRRLPRYRAESSSSDEFSLTYSLLQLILTQAKIFRFQLSSLCFSN